MSQDLARIRDNQRRSRARRKEYIGEIETRLQECERHGSGASYEIQVAAKKVAQENKQLRELLIRNGVNNEEIDAHLRSSSNALLCEETRQANTCVAVRALEEKLSARINCGGRVLTAQMPKSRACDKGEASPISHQMASFGSPSFSDCGTSGETGRCSLNGPLQSLPLGSEQVKLGEISEDVVPNLNDCTVAADIIITMAGGDSNSVKADLGCQPGVDCEVDNQLILSIMDRYTRNAFTA